MAQLISQATGVVKWMKYVIFKNNSHSVSVVIKNVPQIYYVVDLWWYNPLHFLKISQFIF